MATITTSLRGLRHEIDAFSIGTDADIALADAEGFVTTAETTRAERFVFPEHRDRFLRGRGYLRRRLAAALGLRPAEVPLVFGPNGKPGLVGASIAFNMSHCADKAVLALTSSGAVGIDLECLDRQHGFWDDLQGLAGICMTPDEQALLAGLAAPERRRRFLEFWTAKEARMKLTGEGLALDPATISLRLRHHRPEGFATPRSPGCETRFVVLPWPDAICCVVSAAEPGSGALEPAGEFSRERP